MADETKENDEDVCFDPDAYEDAEDDDDDEGRRGNDDDDDGTRPTTTTMGTGTGPTIDDALRRATAERRKEMDAFDAMLVEKFPGTTGADARWERALSKISRDARFRAVGAHGARRSCFDAFVRRMREEREVKKKRKREVGAEDAVMRRERAMSERGGGEGRAAPGRIRGETKKGTITRSRGGGWVQGAVRGTREDVFAIVRGG